MAIRFRRRMYQSLPGSRLREKATTGEVNATLKAAAESSLKGILAYSEEPLVSIDFNGSKLSSVVDGPFTKFS